MADRCQVYDKLANGNHQNRVTVWKNEAFNWSFTHKKEIRMLVKLPYAEVPHKFGKKGTSKNSNEIILQMKPDMRKLLNCSIIILGTLYNTSISCPVFQAVPMVLLATTFAWKHPPCSFTPFVFTDEAKSAHYVRIWLALFFSSNIFWGKLYEGKKWVICGIDKCRDNILN